MVLLACQSEKIKWPLAVKWSDLEPLEWSERITRVGEMIWEDMQVDPDSMSLLDT